MAEELPIAMTTLPTSDLLAMRARNIEMWSDNRELALELQRLTDIITQQELLISTSCGRWLKV